MFQFTPVRGKGSQVTTFSSALALFTLISVAQPQPTADEIDYVFAGMLQEREKLWSGSYEIEGVQRPYGKIKAKVIFKNDKLRFTRELIDQKDTLHAYDDGNVVGYWSAQNPNLHLFKGAEGRKQLYHWDPRQAGFSMDGQLDYRKVIGLVREAWSKASQIKIRNVGGLRIMERTRPANEFFESLLIFKVDYDNGFTPVEFSSDTLSKQNSRFPGKFERITFVTAKWEKVDGVWVAVHHRLTLKNDAVFDEYRLKWEWANREVDDEEFTPAALNVPPGARTLDFRNATKDNPYAEEIARTDAPPNMALRYSLFAALVLVAFLAFWCWRRRFQHV